MKRSVADWGIAIFCGFVGGVIGTQVNEEYGILWAALVVAAIVGVVALPIRLWKQRGERAQRQSPPS